MTIVRPLLITFLILAALLVEAHSAAALSPAAKCEASKLGDAGKYGLCRMKAEEKAIKTNTVPDYTKCDATLSSKWGKAETAANSMCPTNGDETSMQAFITEDTTAIAIALAGGTLPEGVISCNNDLATCQSNYTNCVTYDDFCNTTLLPMCNANYESCQSSLATCTPSGPGVVLKTGQTTAFGPGSDGDLQKGVARSYTDNGDGTITDNATGLMWEKKTDDGSIHDLDNLYTWSTCDGGTCLMDGTIASTFLATLNGGGGFAGHTDWRIPNRFELETIMDLQLQNPAVAPVFNTNCASGCTVDTCSCTGTLSGGYWSSSTAAPFDGNDAWIVDFAEGLVRGTGKYAPQGYSVRAVRGAL